MTELNERQLKLKRSIDDGNIPKIVDATSIWYRDESRIPYHWGDIEAIGYGVTKRSTDRLGNMYLTRHYTGPEPIILETTVMMQYDSYTGEI